MAHPQDHAKTASRRTQDAFKTPGDDPRRPQDAPKRCPFKTRQDPPQDAPRGVPDLPKPPSEAAESPGSVLLILVRSVGGDNLAVQEPGQGGYGVAEDLEKRFKEDWVK